MPTGAQSRSEPRHGSDREPESARKPDVTICEGRPGRSVFIESGNTDGWIAVDHPVDVNR
ncbi:hypothetical protein SAMN04488066_10833 [Halorubrum aquaticum]|uniref:Uncharacterized protein n=1 Tax=Halorubrum aquaticum TaxID=387340 RepID=A0A1I3AXX7_9EURY|nr:hypothetical protein [Halorubrum aquaticum]SFH54917.1 hypothetical protein SAMN04488066_10833 [Halorubrum aquaticum]